MRRCVWYRNLKNEEAMTRVGSQRHNKKKFHILQRDAAVKRVTWILTYTVFCRKSENYGDPTSIVHLKLKTLLFLTFCIHRINFPCRNLTANQLSTKKVGVLIATQGHSGSTEVSLMQTRRMNSWKQINPFTDEAQTALFKHPVRTAQ
jgi:hypothetical protein